MTFIGGLITQVVFKTGFTVYIITSIPVLPIFTFTHCCCRCLIVMGWALASDSVEVTCISFVTPVLEEAPPDDPLYATKVQQGALDSVIFAGMMVGHEPVLHVHYYGNQFLNSSFSGFIKW